jgi:hypothetical protein
MSDEYGSNRQKAIDAYQEYNRGVGKIYAENIRTLDNQILALSAGTLGLSLTFVSNLVYLQAALMLPLLILSWVLLAAAILAVLFGLRYATRIKTTRNTLDAGRQLTGLGKYEKTGPDPESATAKSDAHNERIDLYNKMSVLFFVCALAAMIIFISINVLFGE